ncbi:MULTISPECIES: leucine-rich repeat domain-containing protein [unclassified Lentimicrobium]|uniref:leucine-rich repeat domain-containing protein n=1 Tax=unclassified Lentimicrobium TaxID=2677434 RepID=UPI0015544243|nr:MULTISPECIES: hypothetical protein [unclassified Lentimicrobium]NPD45500.1 hypothetical protein [Lentimicrobium sp. S6]NPD84010.1 hypothetical protein [Lentimicrobium sp. L6]
MIRKIYILLLSFLFISTLSAQKLNPEEVKQFSEECKDLVNYLQFTLNAIGDNELSPKEKDIIISESFAKLFRDGKVQIEDDLVPDREAVTNKEVQAYLKDVDFFFEQAIFSYKVLSVNLLQDENDKAYFKIHALRTISGTNLNHDSIYNEQARFVEVAVNPDLRELKIVSIYTTKINELEENIKWWNDLPISWKEILGNQQKFIKDIEFSRVLNIQKDFVILDPPKDTLTWDEIELEPSDSLRMEFPMATIDTFYFATDSAKAIYKKRLSHSLNKILAIKELDVSGRLDITHLEPVSKLSDIRSLNISGTLVNDLYPIRNLIDLEDLNISNTQVNNLDALVYSMAIHNLNISNTKVYSLKPLVNLGNVNILDISSTGIDDLEPISEYRNLKDLQMEKTMVGELDAISKLKSLIYLNIDSSPISNLSSLEELLELRILSCNNTLIQSIDPLKNMDQLNILYVDNTEITSIKALDGKEKLTKIYCDNTLLGKQKALLFMSENPQVLVVYESRKLQKWFKNLPEFWVEIFDYYVDINIKNPSKEELHQVAGILEIDLSGQENVVSIEPLSQIQNLKKLNLSKTSIESLEPLYELRDLNWLDISYSKVNSLAPLENNHSLQYLNISNTKITNIVALKETSSLNKLYMNNTPIANINPIMGLSGLRELQADETSIAKPDFESFITSNPRCLCVYQSKNLNSWWDGLSPIWKEVFMKTQKWDNTPNTKELHQLIKQTELNIENNRNITSIKELENFVFLKNLRISGTQVSDVNSLSKLSRIQTLDLSQTPILNLDVLAELPLLESVNISNTQINYLDWVEQLTKLQLLDISGTQVKSLKSLSTLYMLETLIAYNTRIANLKPLSELVSLRKLKIYNTKVSSKKVDQFKYANPSCVVDYF